MAPNGCRLNIHVMLKYIMKFYFSAQWLLNFSCDLLFDVVAVGVS